LRHRLSTALLFACLNKEQANSLAARKRSHFVRFAIAEALEQVESIFFKANRASSVKSRLFLLIRLADASEARFQSSPDKALTF
jgi:hypothetical protein